MDLNITEILGTTTVYDSKIRLTKEVKKMFKIKQGDKMVWAINRDGNLILSKAAKTDVF